MSTADQIKTGQHQALLSMQELSAQDFGELKHLLRELRGVSLSLDVAKLTRPVNADIEKHDWLKQASSGLIVNPIFYYDEHALIEAISKEQALFQIRRGLADANATNGKLKVLIEIAMRRVQSYINTTRLARGILQRDDTATSMAVQNKYGVPGPELVAKAKAQSSALCRNGGYQSQPSLARLTPHEQRQLHQMRLDSTDVKEWFEWACSRYGWPVTVNIDKRYQNIGIEWRQNHPTIDIPVDLVIDGEQLLRLIRRKIDCQLRDAMNGDAVLCGMGGGLLGCDDGIITEGHAISAEIQLRRDLFGFWPICPKPWYVLAIQEARAGKSFAQVARSMYAKFLRVEGEPELALQKAWDVCYRVFRGCVNLENPHGYAFTKDKAYLEGFMLAQEMRSRGVEYWVNLGRISLADLKNVAKQVRFADFAEAYQDAHLAEACCQMLLSSEIKLQKEPDCPYGQMRLF